jgi:4Fe-4S ferredoxin
MFAFWVRNVKPDSSIYAHPHRRFWAIDAQGQQPVIPTRRQAQQRSLSYPSAMSLDCRDAAPGPRVVPVIDRSRCEAKADCVRVCPFHVFELRPVPPEDKVDLGLLGRLKLLVHGGKQAYLRAPDDCHACGLCVTSCPEKAIKLTAV